MDRLLRSSLKDECTSMARELQTLIKQRADLTIQIGKLAEDGNYDMVEQLKQQKQQIENRFNQLSGSFIVKCYNIKSDEVKKARELLLQVEGVHAMV